MRYGWGCDGYRSSCRQNNTSLDFSTSPVIPTSDYLAKQVYVSPWAVAIVNQNKVKSVSLPKA